MPRRSNTETNVLERVTDHYLNSGDFNGILLRSLLGDQGPSALEIVKELVQKQLIEVVWEHWDFPHIKRLPVCDPSKQLEAFNTGSPTEICVYPTRKLMKRTLRSNYDRNRPFTRLLALGHPQLEPMFFDLSVLDRYQSDPRYSLEFGGLDGSVCITNEHFRSKSMAAAEKISLQSFGLGIDGRGRRIAVAFLRYLSSLSPRHQQHWESHRLTGKCKVESNYFRRSIFGEWTPGVSVYQALIEEFVHINKLCELIGLPPLFKRDFSTERPKGFGLLTRPTRDSYLEFAHTLDKIVSENLNLNFFKAAGLQLNEEIKRRDGRVHTVSKGTIRLLEEWLTSRIRFEVAGSARTLVAPFKTIHRMRHPRAHSIMKDDYSLEYQRKTEVLVSEVYTSISNIRFLLQSHPKAKEYQFPTHLDPKNILIY
jgi:hypothetical protein